MKERIIQFLTSEKISPAEFADKIGVQRSSMSHILNGRNHPSAAFIQKMLQVYSELNSRWLLIGEGKMYTRLSETVNQAGKSLFHQQDSIADGNAASTASNESLNLFPIVEANAIASKGGYPGEASYEPLSKNPLLNENQKGSDQANVKPRNDPAGEPAYPKLNSEPSAFNESAKNSSLPENLSSSLVNSGIKGEIEQILFFFKDKTFTIYRPS